MVGLVSIRNVVGFCGLFLLVACSVKDQAISTNKVIEEIELSATLPVHTPTPALSAETHTPTAVHWTPIPTIPKPEQEAYILDLIANYDKCTLPCWWGIQPGVTAWEGVREVLGPLGWLQSLEVIGEDGKYEVHETVNQDNYPNMGLTFYSLKQITIQYMKVSGGLYYSPGDRFYYEDFEQAWWRYSIASMLDDFGVPDLVSIYVQPSIGSQIFLIYEQKGIFVRYTFEYLSWYPRTDQFEICPNAENMLEVVLFLKSSSDPTPFEEVVEYMNRSYLGDTKLLEDVTDLSMEEFHTLFVDETAENCLVSSGDTWP